MTRQIIAVLLIVFWPSLTLCPAQTGMIPVVDTKPASTTPPLFGLLDGWPMNEGSGSTFFDIAPTGGVNATQVATPGTWGAAGGWAATPYTFNQTDGFGASAGGTPNYVQSGTAPFSVCAWSKPTSFGTFEILVSNLNPNASFRGWEMSLEATGQVYVTLVNTIGSNILELHQTTTTAVAGANTQTCFTYTGSQTPAGVTIYVNGTVSAGNTTTNNSLSANIGDTLIGLGVRYNTVGSDQNPFLGTVGYASVWSCVLTSGVISANNAAGPSFTGLHC